MEGTGSVPEIFFHCQSVGGSVKARDRSCCDGPFSRL